MPDRTVLALSAATIVAAFGLGGCAPEPQPAPPGTAAEAPTVTNITAPDSGRPLPAPDTLTAILYRLADANVPGSDKMDLLEQATEGDAGGLDAFARALADNGFAPLTFTAGDIGWSGTDPADAVATVVVTPAPTTGGPPFSFPMEFTPHDGGWQLSRKTADLLLQFGAGEATTAPSPATNPAPTPAPTP